MVGATTGGKTYLLQDIAAALQYRMGYSVKAVPGFLDFDDLKRRTSDTSGAIARSKLYACRTHYAAMLSLNGNRDVCRIEFLDVPGECFAGEALEVFKHVKNELLAMNGEHFMVNTWYRGDRRLQTIHLVRTAGENVVPPLATLDEAKPGVERYRTNDEVIASLVEQGFAIDETERHYVNGRYLIYHFFDFVTDTVLNAVIEAWSIIGDAVSDAMGTVISREAIENVHIRNFYYLYFTYAATDVVYCDKCAMPVSDRISPTSDPTSTTAFYDMLSGTMALVTDNHCPPKRWYLAFKGIDSILPQQLYRAMYVRANKDADLVYSMFTLMLARAIGNRPLGASDATTLWQWLTALEHTDVEKVETFKQDLFEMASRVTEQEDDYFNAPDTYVVNSTDHAGRPNAIGDHITARIYSFASAVRSKAHGTIGEVTAMPPHVYFTATPIDTTFKVYGHASDTLFKGATRPMERLCFGSRQLIGDVLDAAGVDLPDGCGGQGKILRYFRS